MKKWIISIVVVAAAIFCGLYFGGRVKIEEPEAVKEDTTLVVESEEIDSIEQFVEECDSVEEIVNDTLN